jgi:predicted  nucleic acid-binding Zn-ribbon protein
MKKEELLIKRLQEDIRKWDLKISRAGVKVKNAKGRQKKEYEKEISDLSAKIFDARKEIEKLEKTIDKFPGPGRDESGGTKTGPIIPPKSTG